MLGKASDEAGIDARTTHWSTPPWCDCLVCLSIRATISEFFPLEPHSLTSRQFSPNAKKVISPADRELMEQHGAAVVECSWVRVKEVPWSRIGGKCERLRM